MKVVIDANVWISAAIGKGAPYVVVDRWLSGGDIEVVMCPELLDEIREVLTTRERLREWISLERATEYVGMIGTMVDLVPDPPSEDVGVRDHEDAYLVILARTHRCDFIVTGDRDLLDWEGQDPPCISPASLIERW